MEIINGKQQRCEGENDMQEIYHNIFQETISYSDRHMSPRNLYLIRQPGRSLMVDTSFRFERDWEILRSMVETLGVSYKDLDVFITHDHPDHSGLVQYYAAKGARILMNPDETKKRADLRHCYLAAVSYTHLLFPLMRER